MGVIAVRDSEVLGFFGKGPQRPIVILSEAKNLRRVERSFATLRMTNSLRMTNGLFRQSLAYR
jgi:hypothetical protein